MLKYLLLIPLWLFTQIAIAQKLSDLSEGDILDVKAIAEDVILQYEGLLNIIADKNTARSAIQKSIDENLDKLFYTSNIKLQNDLNATPSNVVMADASKYLSDFNLYYTKTVESRPVKFSDIKITEPKQGSYLYIQASYNCTFTQVHNLNNTKLPNGKRTADLRIEKQNGEWRVTIASIVLGDNKASNEAAEKQRLAKIEQERIAQEKEKAEQLKQQKAAEEAKQKAAAEKQRLAKIEQERIAQEKEKAEQLKQQQAAEEAKQKAAAEKQRLAKIEQERIAQEKEKAEQLKQQQATEEAKQKAVEEKQRLAKIEQERIAKEKEKAEQLKQQQAAEEAKQKAARKQADKAKLDSMVAARKKIVTKPRQPLPMYVAVSYNALNTDAQKVQGKFSISAFSPSIGVFFSGYKQYKDATPTDYRNTEQLDLINYYLQRDANINGNTGNYTATTYTSSGAKLTTFNWGVYAPAVRHIPAIGGSLWAMGGLAHLKGNVWDIYEGNLNNADNFAPINTYTPDGINQYAVDYTRLNKADLIVGLAYIRPYVQAEIGYNNLLRNFFVNVGANVPIKTKKLKQYKANQKNIAKPKK